MPVLRQRGGDAQVTQWHAEVSAEGAVVEPHRIQNQ